MPVILLFPLYLLWIAFFRLLNIAFLMIKWRQQTPCSQVKPTLHKKYYPIKQQRKPEWIKKEIIRLKAFMPQEGCRKIADTFNRLYADKRNITVGKTFVYYTIQKHRYEIMMMRRKIRNKRPRPLPKNHVWSIDLHR